MKDKQILTVTENDFARGNEFFEIEKWLDVDTQDWKNFDLFFEGKLLCVLSLHKDLFAVNKWYVNLVCGGVTQYRLLTQHNSFEEVKAEYEKKYQEYFSLISEETCPGWFEENGFERLSLQIKI